MRGTPTFSYSPSDPDEIARMRYTEESNLEALDKLEDAIKTELGKIGAAGGETNDAA